MQWGKWSTDYSRTATFTVLTAGAVRRGHALEDPRHWVQEITGVPENSSAGVAGMVGGHVAIAVLEAPVAVANLIQNGGRALARGGLAAAAKRGARRAARDADAMAGGRLGGAHFPESRIPTLSRYLSQRGIELRVGDEFLPPGKAGGFSAQGEVLLLRSNPTRYDTTRVGALHPMATDGDRSLRRPVTNSEGAVCV